MKQLFDSATVRLTGWYLVILACISLLFSVLVYQISIGEIERRLEQYYDHSWPIVRTIPQSIALESVRSAELGESKATIVGVLVYVNVVVLSLGGGLSYLLARRTLKPIAQSHETQTRFVSDASHELRTPLATMTTELEVALSDPALKKDEMRAILESNLEEVQRLSSLSRTLLALSSGQTQTLSHHEFNFSASLQHVIERFNQPPGRIELQMPKKAYYVTGNQPAIEELLSLLIDNALKYSPPKSTVTVSATRRDGQIVVRVHNHGEGITPEHLPYIFNRFYRADSARTGSSGYGLGLALAKQISTLHKSNLTATSSPGKDTVFTFSLPASKKTKSRVKKPSKNTANRP